jgi:DNA-binding response OmpR family regulator
MEGKTRILFVDDEPGIRLTLPAILSGFGFEITVAASVPEALALISTQEFDVLISDLNIGQPGDGFTVVSAMRRTQPEARTFILTGYPAFETALEAIRQQVDDYLVKPANIEMLVGKIRQKLTGPKPANHGIAPKPLDKIVEENKREIVRLWLLVARQDAQVREAGASEVELTEHLPELIQEICERCRGGKFSDSAWKAASDHGHARFRQGYSIPAMIREARILQEAIGQVVQENLLGADVSSVIPQVMTVGATIQTYLEAAIRAYVSARHAAVEHLQPNKGKTVLLLSGDRELGLLKKHVLAQAGFAVTRADSRKEALLLIEQRKFDVLVVSYSLSTDNMLELADLFRGHHPGAPIVYVAKGSWQDLKVDFDATVTGEEGPEGLIEAVEMVLNRKQLRRIK